MTANSPFPIVTVEGDFQERGFQYGSKCKELIDQSLSTYRIAFKKDLNLDWDQALELGRKFVTKIEEYDAASLEEMQGVAEGAGRRFDEILVLHSKTELKLAASLGNFEGCTTLAATPEATQSGNTLVAKNWDWTAATQKLGVILRKKSLSGPSVVTLTEAGLLVRDGFNSAGICVVANALASDKWHIAVPLHVIMNKALRAESLNDAMAAILNTDRASSNNYMLAHSAGEAVCIESAPYNYNIVWEDGGTLAHSNHFTVPNPDIEDHLPSLFPNTLTRLHRASKLLTAARGKIDVNIFKTILTDHFDKPFSICWHQDPRIKDPYQIQTNASFIIDLNKNTMYIALGPPCENDHAVVDCQDIMT